MRVLMASLHCCIRVVKESLALGRRGLDLHFLHAKLANPSFIYILSNHNFFDESPLSFSTRLEALIKTYDFDIIHVHNEPDWLVHVAKTICEKCKKDIPVVFDAHDLNLFRLGKAYPDEVLAFQKADAVIFPSKGYQEKAVEHHKTGDKPTEVIYSMCNDGLLKNIRTNFPRVNGIVYQGGLVVDEENSPIPYRDMREFSKRLTELGYPFHLYGAGDDSYVMDAYGSTGAVIHPSIGYMGLLEQLSRYDWGFVGCEKDHPQWQNAMPNKMFEYILAGIPCLVYNAAEAAEFVLRHNLGVVIKDVNDIPKIYKKHEYYRNIVRQKRQQFSMESQLKKLLGLYYKITDARAPSVLGLAKDNIMDKLKGFLGQG